MKEVIIYYGMAGTFKRTTILAELEKNKNSLPMWSMIKPWKDYEKGIFYNRLPYSDLNYANLHLCRLIDHVHNISSGSGVKTLLIERGVSDMIFYWLGKNNVEDSSWIESVVREENFICEQNSYYTPDRILLEMKDIDFIDRVILRETKRRECFSGGVADYLKRQNDYVDFTKKYNKISRVITIKDAKTYIENDLGLKYDESKI